LPFASPASISIAFSGFPDASSHLGDSCKNGALTTQYMSADNTTNIDKSLHLVVAAQVEMESTVWKHCVAF
jgi:hypothetical protein